MAKPFEVERVNEVRARLNFGRGGEPVTLLDVEKFCATLRGAGAYGGLAITAGHTDNLSTSIVVSGVTPDRTPQAGEG